MPIVRDNDECDGPDLTVDDLHQQIGIIPDRPRRPGQPMTATEAAGEPVAKDGGQPDGSFICGGCGARFVPGERVAEWNRREQTGDFYGIGCPRCGWYKIVATYGAKDGSQ
ncbi:MAG: hypothetical protein IMZ71_02010 [Chloroflexi bacterium]|nr:hypothetical protein [Chloroflexota bacterium]